MLALESETAVEEMALSSAMAEVRGSDQGQAVVEVVAGGMLVLMRRGRVRGGNGLSKSQEIHVVSSFHTEKGC